MLPALQVGQTYTARVAALRSNGRVVLDIHGQQVEAQARAQLVIGQRIRVEVARLWPRVELKLCGGMHKAAKESHDAEKKDRSNGDAL